MYTLVFQGILRAVAELQLADLPCCPVVLARACYWMRTRGEMHTGKVIPVCLVRQHDRAGQQNGEQVYDRRMGPGQRIL